jgi:hypothetical protein
MQGRGGFQLDASGILSVVGKFSSCKREISSDGPVQTIDLCRGEASIDAVEMASSSRSSTAGDICRLRPPRLCYFWSNCDSSRFWNAMEASVQRSAYGGLSSTPRRLLVSTISQVACSPAMWKTAVSGARASAVTKDLIAFFLFFLGSFVLIFRACLYLFYLPGSCL